MSSWILLSSPYFCPAGSEAASCRGVIRAARGLVSDVGSQTAARSAGLTELSSIGESNSGRGFQSVAEQYQLQLPVRITQVEKSPGVRYMGTFHVVALQDWLKFICDHNAQHVLVGLNAPDPKRERAILREFWRLYRLSNPSHDIWSAISKFGIDTARLIPVLMHGDEGRGRRKQPFLITSYHAMIGFGTTLANKERTSNKYLALRLNYTGSTYATRMVAGCLPKMNRDEVALNDLLSFMTRDCSKALEVGVLNFRGERFHAACLNACGDWMWLHKAGNLQRTYNNVPKRPLVPTSKPGGICHLCHAGRKGYDFENLGYSPPWLQTMHLPGDQPWKSRPVLLDLVHDRTKPAAFFAFDIWHAMHLGVAKTFCASVLACMSDLMRASHVDDRFAQLTDLYLQFCDEQKIPAYLTTLTKENCGWFDRGCYPNGAWHKGHISTTLLQFLENWLGKNDVSGNIILTMSKDATWYCNQCFHKTYASDLFLEPSQSREIGQLGMKFLAGHQQLAKQAFLEGKSLFSYLPKIHIIHHSMLELALAVQVQVNPLAWGVQMEEDFIGKLSRLARRVSPLQVILRVIQRSLQAAHYHWMESGFIKE